MTPEPLKSSIQSLYRPSYTHESLWCHNPLTARPWDTLSIGNTVTFDDFTPATAMSKEEWNTLISKIEGIKEVDIPKMTVYKEEDVKYKGNRYRVVCANSKDLLQDRILKNLSVMKSQLMMECAPMLVRRVECKMTPAVKTNIIQAFRRLNSYGKKTPFVARFDEYGRRLEDDVKIETLEGMKISVVDPKDYGELYLEFTGVVEDLFYEPRPEITYKID